jgi:NADP-dependent aldehyde dehydrogenase
VAVADSETSLGEARLDGEISRTASQLRMFADALLDGDYLEVVITPGDENRPDVRRMLFPVGPVAVFAASNFPFAFSVLGGDTASALAAGCPVIVKAHDGHPRTSAAVAEVARGALAEAGAPIDLLQVVYGLQAGIDLITSPVVKAAGFTGSLAGGRALFDLCAGRPDPIPFFGELGSVNPVVILPDAAATRAKKIAEDFVASLTLGSGQFCTSPGILFVPEGSGIEAHVDELIANTPTMTMLNERILQGYEHGIERRDGLVARSSASSAAENGAEAVVWTVSLAEFSAHRDQLSEEVFGPASVVVTYPGAAALLAELEALPGTLTACVHAETTDYNFAAKVADVLRERAGRLVLNGWPTGVSVCWAMHHGGPWPATTDGAHTSVGLRAIDRWLRPTAFQGWPDKLLPVELRESNPEQTPRLVQPG